jgi:DNA-binding response OmpR family regulator
MVVKILVVDDEPDVVEVVKLTFKLQWAESEVISAADGEEALEVFQRASPNAVILDVGLPGMNGFEVCRRLRETSDVPILMLTIKGEEIDRLRGLELGADDYIVKPFSPLELMARTRAVLRRTQAMSVALSDHIVVDEDLAIDLDSHQAVVRGEPVRLTPTEVRILAQLVHSAGQVLSQRALVSKVWGWESPSDVLLLKVHIARLREKLGDEAQNSRYIFTERGRGYRFVKMPVPPSSIQPPS